MLDTEEFEEAASSVSLCTLRSWMLSFICSIVSSRLFTLSWRFSLSFLSSRISRSLSLSSLLSSSFLARESSCFNLRVFSIAAESSLNLESSSCAPSLSASAFSLLLVPLFSSSCTFSSWMLSSLTSFLRSLLGFSTTTGLSSLCYLIDWSLSLVYELRKLLHNFFLEFVSFLSELFLDVIGFNFFEFQRFDLGYLCF